ncbi:hypothetical protein H4W34_001163 [Actinomadura algeriensis]|uniref:Beta-lactamase-related domain-containing protein n=1 Tax=Actinomadura algeriensis TaxID=1679523 RepID=A0ABR9JMH5_9ACTN|nr:hypothetical protein [Actinomadura algeriensis]
MAGLAAEDRFSGVVMLSHRGRTVLSRSYGMADEERGIRNHEGVAFNLSSAGKPFGAVAVMQLVQPALIVEAVTGTAFYTRPQWLTDEHIAHSYIRQADGSRVDAVRNLDKGSPDPRQLGKNRAATSSIPRGTAVSPPRRTWSGSRTRWATARCWTVRTPRCSPRPRGRNPRRWAAGPAGRPPPTRRSGRTRCRSASSRASG